MWVKSGTTALSLQLQWPLQTYRHLHETGRGGWGADIDAEGHGPLARYKLENVVSRNIEFRETRYSSFRNLRLPRSPVTRFVSATGPTRGRTGRVPLHCAYKILCADGRPAPLRESRRHPGIGTECVRRCAVCVVDPRSASEATKEATYLRSFLDELGNRYGIR